MGGDLSDNGHYLHFTDDQLLSISRAIGGETLVNNHKAFLSGKVPEDGSYKFTKDVVGARSYPPHSSLANPLFLGLLLVSIQRYSYPLIEL